MNKKEILESVSMALASLREDDENFKYLLAVEDKVGLHLAGTGSHSERMGLAEAVKIKVRVDLIKGLTRLEREEELRAAQEKDNNENVKQENEKL